MTLTPNQIKKHVTRRYYSLKDNPAPLLVNEHDGEMWATNKYFLTRAERVAPLLEQYNLSVAEPGSYEVNGTVKRADGASYGCPAQPANVGAFIKDLGSFMPAIAVRIAGLQAYVLPDGPRLGLHAAFLLADGTHAGLHADELEWLLDTLTAPLPEQTDGTYLRYGDAHVSFSRNSHGIPMAVISAEVFHILERARYDSDAHDCIPAVEEPCPPRVLGHMMGMSFGG
jgi:hypothetical protein